MSSISETIGPINRAAGRRTAIDVYELLQSYILNGALKPGAVISQVAIAEAMKVSRTPVREAVRMLQESGLLTSEPNFRSRVIGFDPVEVESLYMRRIALESLCVAMTARDLSDDQIVELEAIIADLEGDHAHDNFTVWQKLHRKFHKFIVSGASEVMIGELEQLELRSGRYQSAYKGSHLPGWWHRGETEHHMLFSAIIDHDAALAGELSARHLARTALELIAVLSPEFDTAHLRTALRFAIAGSKSV